MKRTLTRRTVMVSLALLVLLASASLYAAGQGEPAVSAPKGTSFRFACRTWDENPPMNDLWIWKAYEKKTGVHIDWEEIPKAAANEKKNLMFASNDLPDAFWQMEFSVAEISRYGSQGMLAPVDGLLDKYAPALTALMKRMPAVRAVVTMGDGHIYSFPYVSEDGNANSLRYYLNQKWMDRLGIAKRPDTLDEFYDILVAFKTKDANGNGDPNDEYPIYLGPGSHKSNWERQLFGCFGIGDWGLQAARQQIYLDKNGKIDFIFWSQGGKEVWQYQAKLWKAGLFHPETFTGYDYARWVADGTKDLVGCFSWVGPAYLGEAARDNFTGVTQMAGPRGERVLTWIDVQARGNWSFLITNKCGDVPTAVTWADYFYSPEGSLFGFLGTEGETYNTVGGVPLRIDAMTKYKGGVQLGAFQYGLFVYGGYYPNIEPPADVMDKINGFTTEWNLKIDANEYKKYAPKEMWPQFPPVGDEAQEIQTILTDVDTYTAEARVKFITGAWNFESDWDAYVKQLEKMKVKRYIEIRQTQYDRFKKNK